MTQKTRKWILVAAARPNFMKIAPLIRAIAAYNSANPGSIRPFLVHTGQHYDANMSDDFFRDLAIPAPDIHLGIGSGSHAEQTGRVLIAFEEVLLRDRPDLVIVVGDVNSTMACTLAAVKLHIPVAHVEAGLRSFDRRMPEEINRLVTDALADYLFTPSPDGDANLIREGIPKEKIFLVGDIMVDSLLFNLEIAKKRPILARLGLTLPDDHMGEKRVHPYALVTLHRPSNVDERVSFERIVGALLKIAVRLPVLFPIHPRTRKQVQAFEMEDAFIFHPTPELCPEDYYALMTHAGDDRLPSPLAAEESAEEGRELKRRIHAFEPLGYLDFLNLMAHAAVVLTDSGGIQEETTVLNVPCITLRDTTERPITLTEGTNVLVHDDPERIVAEVGWALAGKSRRGNCPTIWDGHTAERIVRILTPWKIGTAPN
ncbi:MAG: UDP-N-acetylglucosamine 2-epimerase (non-hydrolyzing) [Syntrophus sp. (in: bacteria)]|nr:UDP-N-acetylglucosamine 2-epimerase (non-hydrolyzing) [Syntrophus sp. (in: bacteria)]